MTDRDHRAEARAVVVRGEVQGVLFRDSCRAEAQAHGVNGWVRNEHDGSVRARLEGRPEAVAAVLAWMSHGPPHARVAEVDVAVVEPEGADRFEVR
jgi:acylphosphatase